ncbi:hypothetical protein PU683_14980 [Kosakonia cowanii]|uniref:hypothetical protein n=1 Tax=Kosakonia cowanii TaxID=208223 RepID=UPI0023F96629|nr:hypothetical protein [Kosakonia cowanii]MDF7760823.1 hypothetical protein [Kosakonia cowanii]
MSNILARVELHGADEEAYELLHKHMAAQGFIREIPQGDGTFNQLPDATYISDRNEDLESVRKRISLYADRLGKTNASVFICEFNNCAWYLFEADD